MKVEGMLIKQETYKDKEYYALYIVIDKKEYLLGTLKGKEFKYIKSICKGGK